MKQSLNCLRFLRFLLFFFLVGFTFFLRTKKVTSHAHQSAQNKDSFELFYIQCLFKRIFLQFPKEPHKIALLVRTLQASISGGTQ